MFYVEVIDPPDTPTSRPRHFRLGPFEQREEAERLARRATATSRGSEARVICACTEG